VQGRTVRVRVRSVNCACPIARQRVRGSNEWRRKARAPNFEPSMAALVRRAVVHRCAGARIRIGSNVDYRAPNAASIFLPARLGLVGAATAARAAPHALALICVVGIQEERGPAHRGYVLRRCRILDTIAAVTGRERDRMSDMVKVVVT
jgi:hypothetical protein